MLQAGVLSTGVQQDAHVHALDDLPVSGVVVIAVAVSLAGCGGGASGSTVSVVAPDAVLRALGEPCAGAEPFLYAHATAAYRIEGAGGRILARGSLPEGRAIPAFNHDPGLPRVPTFCRFTLRADLPAGARNRLVLDEGDPLPFSIRGGRATVVLG
jgi:hypothetical protein